MLLQQAVLLGYLLQLRLQLVVALQLAVPRNQGRGQLRCRELTGLQAVLVRVEEFHAGI